MNLEKTFSALIFAFGIAAFGADAETEELLKFAPEAQDYKLVYAADVLQGVDKFGNIKYEQDNSAEYLEKPFTSIAYYLRIVGQDDKVQQVFVTMDAFTKDVKVIGVPAMHPKKSVQMMVSNLTVKSDVPDVRNGSFQQGNIEFWATNYGPENANKVPGASGKLYDFGDQRSANGNYGSMQVHNFMEKQVVFAVNHWAVGKNADVGIGNRTSRNSHPDWTFSQSGKNCKSAMLLVLVK